MRICLTRSALCGVILATSSCGKEPPLVPPGQTRYNTQPPTEQAPAIKISTPSESQAASMPNVATNIERRTITFSGRVQGVGFRATTAQFAEGLPLAGQVRNLEDGRVELVLEGDIRDIDAFVKKLSEHFGSYIRSIEQSSSRPVGLPAGVRITF